MVRLVENRRPLGEVLVPLLKIVNNPEFYHYLPTFVREVFEKNHYEVTILNQCDEYKQLVSAILTCCPRDVLFQLKNTAFFKSSRHSITKRLAQLGSSLAIDEIAAQYAPLPITLEGNNLAEAPLHKVLASGSSAAIAHRFCNHLYLLAEFYQQMEFGVTFCDEPFMFTFGCTKSKHSSLSIQESNYSLGDLKRHLLTIAIAAWRRKKNTKDNSVYNPLWLNKDCIASIMLALFTVQTSTRTLKLIIRDIWKDRFPIVNEIFVE